VFNSWESCLSLCFELVLTCGVWCYILYYTLLLLYIYYYYTYTIIIYYTLLILSSPHLSSILLFPPPPLLSSSSSVLLISFHSILVGTYIYLFILSSVHSSPLPFLSHHPPPNLSISLSLLSQPSIFLFYFLIHSILVGTYIYLFIFQTHLPLQSISSSSIPLLPIFPSLLYNPSQYSFLSHPNIHSILVGTWIHIFIFFHLPPKYLTPHVLSEWMVEVCGAYLCGVYVSCWWMLLVFRSDCKVFGCISSKSEQNWCFELVDGVFSF
jgi:hypothetical protein